MSCNPMLGIVLMSPMSPDKCCVCQTIGIPSPQLFAVSCFALFVLTQNLFTLGNTFTDKILNTLHNYAL